MTGTMRVVGLRSDPSEMAASRSSRPPRSQRFRRVLLGFALPVVLISIWQLLKSVGALPYSNVPSPIDIVTHTGALVSSGQLPLNVGHTLIAWLGGWAIGSAIGLIIGLVLGMSLPTWTYSMASVDVLRAIPAIAFVPITVIIFAQSLQMEIVITAWVSIWPVAVSTINGASSMTEMHHELARSLHLSTQDRIIKFAIPSAMPKILVGLRLSLSGALALAIVAEIVGDPAGIGYALVKEQLSLQPAAMFSYIGITGVLGLSFNALLSLVFRRFVPSSQRGEGAPDVR